MNGQERLHVVTIEALEDCRRSVDAAQDELERVRDARRVLANEAITYGIGPGAVARALGISAQRLAQLRNG